MLNYRERVADMDVRTDLSHGDNYQHIIKESCCKELCRPVPI